MILGSVALAIYFFLFHFQMCEFRVCPNCQWDFSNVLGGALVFGQRKVVSDSYAWRILWPAAGPPGLSWLALHV